MNIAVVDSLGRASGDRYSTFDVVGAGPRIVAGIAEKHGSVAFYTYEKATRKLDELVKENIVLISAMSSDYNALSKFVLELRRKQFRGKVIAGGPISFEYWRVLQELPVDLVIVGEGEIPLEKLLKSLEESKDISEVPALAYRDNAGTIKLTSRHLHTPKELLSAIKPWTKVNEGFEFPQLYRFYVEIVRGCSNFARPMIDLPGTACKECLKCRSDNLVDRLTCPAGIPPGCGFCSVPHMFGPPRSREIKSIKEEVENLISHGARRIVLSAPDFLDYGREELVNGPLTNPCNPPANIELIEELLNQLHAIDAVSNKKVVISAENIKACLVTDEVGKVLGRYLRGTTIHIGLETCTNWFNSKVLGKPITVEQVIKASRILKDCGLRPYVYLMYGLPLASRRIYEDMISSISKLWSCGVEKITLYKFVNLPGTAFSDIKVNAEKARNVIYRLKKAVDAYNTATKRQLVGKEIEVFLLERDGKVYGYPAYHGPVVFVAVKNKVRDNLSGCKGYVRIADFSRRFVRGELLRLSECFEFPQVSAGDGMPP
ncbi:MAG: radical SAM protein [Desulfurococcaceae archaeon]